MDESISQIEDQELKEKSNLQSMEEEFILPQSILK